MRNLLLERTRQGAAVLLAIGALGLCDCKKTTPEGVSSADASPPASASIPVELRSTAHLDAVARRAVGAIGTMETTKDVTCWTSFRQLDNFIAGGKYSSFAVLEKIAAVKALVRAAWEKASAKTSAPTVTAADLRAAATISDEALAMTRREELAAYATQLGMKAYKDYRTTSEHWRIILSIVQDEILAGGTTTLKPLAENLVTDAGPPVGEGLDALADLTTRLSLLLLESSGKLAQEERSPLIEAPHVKRAYATLSTELGLTNTPRRAETPTPDEIKARLAPLTHTLIEGKIRALQVYNKDTTDLTTDLNRVSKVPLQRRVVDWWVSRLRRFAAFVAGGYEPQQSESFNAQEVASQYTTMGLTGKPYVTARDAENSSLQLFPHIILPNADVRLRLEPAPDARMSPVPKAEDILVLDYRQNAVRDTAVHWIVLDDVWKQKAFAMDPFAAEYLSEVISTMMAYYIVRAEKFAAAAGAKEIDMSISKKVLDDRFTLGLPVIEESKPWTPEQWKKKAAVLAAYPAQLFKEAPTPSPERALPPMMAVTNGKPQGFMGAAVAVGDIDRDGYPDLFIAGEGQGRLLRNRGKEAPGRFVDVTEAWGVPAPLDDARGALLFDLEGDGDMDLLVIRSEHHSLLLRQDAPGKFTDVAETLGFVTAPSAQVASVFDYDMDGDLDVFVGHYGGNETPALDGKNGTPSQLFRMGPDGHFTEVAKAAGVRDTGWTLATSTFDYDNDGDLDLFLANDFGPDVFYQNAGDGTFRDVSRVTDTDDRGSGMNVSFTDVNGDGWLDLYVSNIDMFSKSIKVVYPTDTSTIKNFDANLQASFQYLSGNKLFVNPGDKRGVSRFTAEEGTRFEPGDRGWSWAAVFFDYDNDGDDDMYLSNGWVDTSVAANQRHQMFLNDAGIYYVGPPGSPETFASNARSVVAFDMDKDGDLDLVVNNFRQKPVLLENTQAAGNHAVSLRLLGARPNTGAIGARITVSAGGRKQIRDVTCGIDYLGQKDEVLSFGIGKATEADVTVRWPRGKTQTLAGVKADAIVDVKEE